MSTFGVARKQFFKKVIIKGKYGVKNELTYKTTNYKVQNR